MAARECERCGEELGNSDKNAAGHYRDRCGSCLQVIADAEPSHRDQCEEEGCLICSAP